MSRRMPNLVRLARRLASLAAVVLFAVALLGCGDDSTGGSGEDGLTELFTRENWALLVSDPDAQKGARVDIAGRVFQVERDEDGVYLQVWADPQNSEWNTIVGHADPDFQVSQDDYVQILGTVKGAFEGENAFGAKITAVQVLASTLKIVDATAAGPKASRTVTGLGVKDQHGLSLAVTKIEFAATETRVFVTIKNGTDSNASFYSFDTKATQGSKQFEAESFSDYPEVQSDLLPGTESSGVIVFGAMNLSLETKLYFEARTDDYDVEFESYVFTAPAR